MRLRAMQGLGVFAINIEITDTWLYPGICLINETANIGKPCLLFDNLNPSDTRYLVQLPDAPGVYTIPVDGKFKLKIIEVIKNDQPPS